MFNYKSEIKGKGDITARVVAKSKSSSTGKVITTYELLYPRFIHSELMTHRMFSRNAASSRAIPVKKTIEQVRLAPAMPVHWGKNQPGMQAKEECDNLIIWDDAEFDKISLWKATAYDVSVVAECFDRAGYHKQVVNRILEPFVFMKTVLTTTEEANWYYLRDHEDADPTICELAKCMREATGLVEAEELQPGDWHVPYVRAENIEGEGRVYFDEYDGRITAQDALVISSSCCAQVSFRMLDGSLEKADKIFDRLVNSKPVHASPFEHQGSPMEDFELGTAAMEPINDPFDSETWQTGITHVNRNGDLWSGNFCGWIQHRQLIPNNVVYG